MKVYLVSKGLEQYQEELEELLPGMLIEKTDKSQFSIVDIDCLETVYEILNLNPEAIMRIPKIHSLCDFIINLEPR